MTALVTPFNSALESGVRSLFVLAEHFPISCDIERLVDFDYLAVHSGDFDDEYPSLHAPVPTRAGELLVRRDVVERGVLLMASRRLAERHVTSGGFGYRATDEASAFLNSLVTPYSKMLRERAKWVMTEFGTLTRAELRLRISAVFHVSQFETFTGSGAPS